MNKGLLDGWNGTIGTYLPIQNGTGTFGPGNRGRFSVDEIRMFGYPDNNNAWGSQATGTGAYAGRLINSFNQQAQHVALAFPGDVGCVLNIFSGTIAIATNPPFNGGYNTGGSFRCTQTSNLTLGMYGANSVVFNDAQRAMQLPVIPSFLSVPLTEAIGAACTCAGTGNSVAGYSQADFTSHPAYNSFGGGTLNVTGQVIGFASSAQALNNGTGTGATTIATRVGFQVQDCTVGTTSSITTQYGFDTPILTAATNNTGIRIGQGGQTFTAAAGIGIDFYQGTNTFNFASGWAKPMLNTTGTFSFTQSGLVFGVSVMMTDFGPTIKNTAADAVGVGTVYGHYFAPTYQADTQTSFTLVNASSGFVSNPTFSVINGATTITDSSHTGHSSGGVVNTGHTVTTWTDFQVQAVTGSGAITTQVGLDIAALTKATTSIGVRLAAQANPFQMGMTTTGPTTANLASNGNAVMTLYHGATNYYWLIAWNDAGTVRYKYLQLNGTGVTWVTGTSSADMTDEPIDLASIVDLNYLKAMAYDRLAAIDQLQNELRMVNERIAQLDANPVPPPSLEPKKK
jgi:hypothetical protein